jgi:hypothetical protein
MEGSASMSRTQSFIRSVWAQVVAASKVQLRIIDGVLSWTPTRVNKTPLQFGLHSARRVAPETPAEYIRNALSILQLTAVHVYDRADEGSVVFIPLEDWNAARARLARAVCELEQGTFPDPTFVPVSGDTRPPTRNVTTRERHRLLDSTRDAERLRAFYGVSL